MTERAYLEAIATAEAITRAIPDDVTARRELAIATTKRGNLYYMRHRWRPARELLDRALTLTEQCLAVVPDDRNLCRDRLGNLFVRAICGQRTCR